MVGFRRIKTKWLVTAAMVLAVALAFGIWLHHRAAVAARFTKYAMKLREQEIHKLEPPVLVPTSSRPATQHFPWKTNIVTVSASLCVRRIGLTSRGRSRREVPLDTCRLSLMVAPN